MNNNQYDEVREYVKGRVGDDNKVQLLIFDFAILWNIYEKELYATNHSISVIHDVLKELEFLDSDKENIDLLYWQLFDFLSRRGCTNSFGEIDYDNTCIYFNLRITKTDADGNIIQKGEISEYILKKIIKDKESIGRLNFMLIIVARVRNNLFHGLKDISLLKENENLFVICNSVLKLILDVKKRMN